jgi:uncharacterized protein YprB with RNaseH-like and TPR domain
VRIGFYDIETSDLKALMGRVLCASVVPLTGKAVTFRADDPQYKTDNPIDDSVLVKDYTQYLDDNFDMIVGWNSKLFDLPFLNARLAKAGLQPFKPHFHLDIMWYAGGGSLRIGSRKLDNVAKYFKSPNQKTPIEWDQWQLAMMFDQKAMDNVVKHCEADVKVLRDVYHHLLPYVANIHR